jgi:hypothetical protein
MPNDAYPSRTKAYCPCNNAGVATCTVVVVLADFVLSVTEVAVIVTGILSAPAGPVAGAVYRVAI